LWIIMKSTAISRRKRLNAAFKMGWLIKEAFLYISKAHRVRGREVQISLSYKFIHLKNARFLT